MATEDCHRFSVDLLRRKFPGHDATIPRTSKQHLIIDSRRTNQPRRPLKTSFHPCLCVPCLVPIKTISLRLNTTPPYVTVCSH
uniref:Uncharacterized protein n=1 Tax=Arundo donax TaxID=35708 RepID=A0A0A9D358_ARUDO